MPIIVFRTAIETSLRDGLGPRFTERLATRFAEAGVDFSKPLLPGYPPEVFVRCIAIVAEEVFPGRPIEEVQAEVAEGGFRAFTSGFLGAAVAQVMRAVGSKRTLQRVDRFLKNGQSEMKLRFTDRGPTDCEVSLSPVLGMPHYYRGMLLGGARMLALQDLDVQLASSSGDEATYRVRWSEK